VDHRLKHGPFRRLEDLLNVPGIGPATLERIRPWVTVSPEP
jgi:competence protein ComEA